MKTNTKNHPVWQYIINAIDSEAYEVTTTTEKEKLQFLADCFKKEYCFENNLMYYKTYQNCLANWIMGLPSVFNIDFENYRIIEIAKEWESLPINATEKQEDKIIENWFQFIANKTMQLWSKNGINIFN